MPVPKEPAVPPAAIEAGGVETRAEPGVVPGVEPGVEPGVATGPAADPRPTRRDDVLPGGARHCFACGDDNPIGLRLPDIRREGEEVHATLRPRADYMGWPGVLHGGITATALDEAMGWASILLAGVWTATGTMELRYRSQVPLDVPLRLVAGIVEARGRTVRAWSKLLLPDGTVAAEATGLLVRLPEPMVANARRMYGSDAFGSGAVG
jgi:acyl-coenzyme A thioesterase PaaI-like protein